MNRVRDFLSQRLTIFFLFTLIVYSILYILTLNTNYVEGDDASTVLYHLFGRVKSFQQPYSSYHSGFDFLLSFLPQDEIILRNFAVIVSFLGGWLVFFFSGVFIYKLSEEKMSSFYLMFLLPFVIPDLLFNSLLYNPTNIGFALALGGILCLIQYLKNERHIYLIGFVILTALAVPFRWSLVFMYPIYVGVTTLIFKDIPTLDKTIKLSAAMVLSVALALMGIAFTGYSLTEMIETYTSARAYVDKTDVSMLSLVANAIAWFTIPSLIILIFTFKRIISQNIQTNLSLFCFAVLSIFPYFFIGFYTNLKFSITLLPLFIILLAIGMEEILSFKLAKVALIGIIVLIWFLGVKIDMDGTAYGPGFENKKITVSTLNVSPRNPDKRISIKSVSVGTEGGLLMQTLEGPRPLFGYFYVIFGRGWFNYIDNFYKDRLGVIKKLENDKELEFFQDGKTAYLQCDMFRSGYVCNSGFEKNLHGVDERRFVLRADTINLQVIPDRVDKAEWIMQYKEIINKPVLLRSSYTSTVSQVETLSEKHQKLNPFTIILE